MFCELINAEYFMKTLNITSVFVSRITVATKLLKMCLSNIDEIFSVEKRSRSPSFLSLVTTRPIPYLHQTHHHPRFAECLFVNISLATVTSLTVTSSKLNVENSAKWLDYIIYVTKYEWKGF